MSELQSDPWANSKHSDIHSTVSSQTTFLVFCLSRWTAKGAPAGEQHHKASCVPYHRCVHGWPGFTPQSKARWGTWDSSSSRSWSEIPREQTNSSGILSILFGFPPFMSFYAKRDKVTERQSRSNVISSHCTFRGLNSDFRIWASRTRSLVSLVPSSKQKWKITDTEQNPPSEDPKQTSVLIYSLIFSQVYYQSYVEIVHVPQAGSTTQQYDIYLAWVRFWFQVLKLKLRIKQK